MDLLTGQITGYVWGANLGWVRLGNQLSTVTIACTDTDVDGIGDEWEIQHFDNLDVVSAGTDFDSDGVDDASEYLADTDPQDPQDRLRVVGHDYDSAFSVAVVRFTSRPTRVYRIATSGDLIHWDDSNLGRFLPDLGTVTGREIGIPGGQRLFIRVSATKPLQP